MKIRPLHNYVIVDRNEAETRSSGGIVIPDTAAQKPDRGKIVAVGRGKVTNSHVPLPVAVKPGDEVLFGKFGGTEIRHEGKALSVIHESEILAVFG